jgi:hypothetical protein
MITVKYPDGRIEARSLVPLELRVDTILGVPTGIRVDYEVTKSHTYVNDDCVEILAIDAIRALSVDFVYDMRMEAEIDK